MLDKPWYEPGDSINGIVYIRTIRNISGVQGIEFKIKGGLKHAFTRYWTEWETDGEDEEGKKTYTAKHYNERLKDSNKFMSHTEKVSETFANLAPGDYVISFKA